MEPVRVRQLANGLRIAIYDRTNRYFGDYHRVCLHIVMTYDLAGVAAGAGDPFWAEALVRLGPELRIEKSLERMGVAGDHVEATVTAMADDFLTANEGYMDRADYLRRLVAKKMAEDDKMRRIY